MTLGGLKNVYKSIELMTFRCDFEKKIMKRIILTYFLYIKETIKKLLKRLALKLCCDKALGGLPIFIDTF